MASNQYRQQWQQGPTQVQQPYHYDRHYDRRNDQMQWQENGHSQGAYNQEYQRYNEAPKGRNGYGPGPAPAPLGYDQQGEWQIQDQYSPGGYQDQYNDNGNGYAGGEPYYEQAAPATRTYHYDERYRTTGQGRPAPEQHHSNHSSGHRPPRDQRSEPPAQQKRHKPRERILAEPTSPKSLAWDNPFGAFPSKKKQVETPRHSSLDAELNNLNLHERRDSEEPRPHTSHGQRRKETSGSGALHDQRPGTGYGQQDLPPAPPDMVRPPPQQNRQRSPPQQDYQRPSPPQQDYQRPPPQHSHPRPPRPDPIDVPPPPRHQDNIPQSPRRPPRPDVQGPPPSRLQDNVPQSPRRPARQETQGPPPPRPQDNIPQSPRHAPRPNREGPPPGNQDRSRPGPYGGLDGYGAQGSYDGGRNYPPQDSRRNDHAPRDQGYLQDHIPPQEHRRNDHIARDQGYSQDRIPPSRAQAPPIHQRPAPRPPALEHFDSSAYRTVPNGALNKTRSNEVPNFDAIPAQPNEKAEFDQQIYQKPTYQVPGAFPASLNTEQTPQTSTTDLNSPLAEFAFDIGPNPNNRPPPTQAGYGEQRRFDPRTAPTGGYEDIPRQQAQYPPRSASRNGIKPAMNNVPPLPSDPQGYRSFSQGQYPPPNQGQYPPRPHTSSAQRPPPQSYDMGNPYGPEFRADSAPAGPGPQNPGYSASPVQQFRQPYVQGPNLRKPSQDNYATGVAPVRKISQDNYNLGVVPDRKMSQDNYNPGPPRPSTSSAHPVPVRHYGNTNTDASVNVNVNPDALPAHPEPVRTGGSNGYTPQPAPQPAQRKEVAPPAQAAAGPQVTLQELNDLRGKYTRNPADHAVGLVLAKKLVEGAKVLSDEGGKADAKQTQKNREKYIFDAHKLVKKLVAANYPEAMFYLADCHGQGLLGLPVDPKEAFHLYQSAAKLGHAPSAYRVAVCCELGSEEGGGTRRDPMKAMQWYKRAATLGDAPAMYKMGMILLKGLLGQQKNPREAVSWLKRAAERADKDNPHALHELGLLYESATSADHIVKDEAYSLQLFQQAAELGYKYSQFRLGSAYEYGLLGCPIDPRQSIAWYSKAAAQGEHQSELALSGWYLTGSEPLLQQSDTEAFLWARKAAGSGLAKAEYAMGYFYEVGIGTAVDVEEAKRWYYRAASQYFPKARERLEELKKGQKMQKTRVSRSNVNRQSDGECVVM